MRISPKILTHPSLCIGERLYLLWLYHKAKGRSSLLVGDNDAVEQLHVSRSAVQRWKKNLRDLGYLRTPGKAENAYQQRPGRVYLCKPKN